MNVKKLGVSKNIFKFVNFDLYYELQIKSNGSF